MNKKEFIKKSMKHKKEKFLNYIKQNISGITESHLDCWFNERYQLKNKDSIEFDLNVNHDDNLEIENLEIEFLEKFIELIETETKRKLTMDEKIDLERKNAVQLDNENYIEELLGRQLTKKEKMDLLTKEEISCLQFVLVDSVINCINFEETCEDLFDNEYEVNRNIKAISYKDSRSISTREILTDELLTKIEEHFKEETKKMLNILENETEKKEETNNNNR